MNETVKTINLLDLSVEILLRWRRIVVYMLVGAVLFAAVSYVKSGQTVAAQKAAVEKARIQLEELLKEVELDPAKLNRKILEKQMTDTQIYNVDYVLTNEKFLADKTTYMENSALMKLDSNSVKKAEVTFVISSIDMTKTYNIQKVYEDLMCSGELMKAIAARMDMKAEAVAEVVGLEKSTYSTMEGADSVRMYVKHNDESAAMEMIGAVIDFVAQKQETLQEELGAHEIIVLEPSVTVIMDTNVMTQQQNCFREINNVRKSIIESKKAFSKLEWWYYDIRLNGELTELSQLKIAEMEEKELEAAKSAGNKAAATGTIEDIEALEAIIETGVTASTGISIRYIILGMILAAFVYVFVIFVRVIFDNKIGITDNLQEMYRITQLGRIPEKQDKKRLFGFVDEWLIAIRDRNRRRFSEAEALELAAVAVKMAAGKEAMNAVYVMGCDLKGRSLAVCERLEKMLQQENIQVKILNNVLYNAQELEQLQQARCAVLVEKAGSTLYDEITQELMLLKRQDIAVLGGIIVE